MSARPSSLIFWENNGKLNLGVKLNSSMKVRFLPLPPHTLWEGAGMVDGGESPLGQSQSIHNKLSIATLILSRAEAASLKDAG